jgi:hypothetical protein
MMRLGAAAAASQYQLIQESTQMINRLLKLSYAIIAVGLLLTQSQYASATSIDDDLTPEFRFEYFVPAPLEPQISRDGKTLWNAGLPAVYVADPNPSHELVRIPPPIDLLNPPESATSTFSITYVPNGGTDPWGQSCFTFPDEAKAAFNAASTIWSNILQSPVPITIRACWANLGSGGTLGYSGGQPLQRDFPNSPRANTWYNGSLANALAGSDLDPSGFDMHITYNLNFSWYYGMDGNTPWNQYDLMSVVLHEIAHGLNFSGSMMYSGGQAGWGYSTGYPNIYDTFMRDGSGNQLINTGVYGNPSAALGSALTSNNIWFHGTNAMAANGGQRVKMYAPSPWSGGSSYSHLDYFTFQGTGNRLMVYAISAGVSTHDPGPVTKGLLKDLGWPTPSPSIRITSPNGGEFWTAGSTHTTTWISSDLNPAGGIYIFYWYNNTWQPIAGPLATYTTSYPWTVPNSPTTSAILVGNWVNNAWEVSDQSDQAFTIIGDFIYVAQGGQCGGNNPCFPNIQNGIASASAPSTIRISQETYHEDIILDFAEGISLQGGWDANFSSNSSYTTIQGSITITNGTMILENIILR